MPKIINDGTVTEWAPLGDGIGSVELFEKYMQAVVDEARKKNPSLVKTVKVRMSERTGMLECVVSPVLEFQFRVKDRGVGSAAYSPEEYCSRLQTAAKQSYSFFLEPQRA